MAGEKLTEADRRGRRVPTSLIAHLVVAAIAMVAGTVWALSSPVGAGPDDDYHLTSIWCPPPLNSSGCQTGVTADGKPTVYVPALVTASSVCFAFDHDRSAACTKTLGNTLVPTGRFDQGQYPGQYYHVMHLFVGPNIAWSVMTMRLVNLLIGVGLLTAASLLASRAVRPVILAGFLATSVPLGVFLIPSTNPTSWAVTGIAGMAAGLLGAFSLPPSARRWGAVAVAALGAILAAFARGDSGIHILVVLAAVAVLFWRQIWAEKKWFLILAAFVPLAIWTYTSGRQTSMTDFGSRMPATIDLFVHNLFRVADIVAGVFGTMGGLGWLDTGMPPMTWVGGLVAAAMLFGIGLRSMGVWKALAVSGAAFTVVAIPMAVFQMTGEIVGQNVQPRYIQALVVLTLMLALLRKDGHASVRMGVAPLVVVALLLASANTAALHTNIRRYISGFDVPAADLNVGVEWWWPHIPNPGATWLIGSIAFLLLALAMPAQAWFTARRLRPAVAASAVADEDAPAQLTSSADATEPAAEPAEAATARTERVES